MLSVQALHAEGAAGCRQRVSEQAHNDRSLLKMKKVLDALAAHHSRNRPRDSVGHRRRFYRSRRQVTIRRGLDRSYPWGVDENLGYAVADPPRGERGPRLCADE